MRSNLHEGLGVVIPVGSKAQERKGELCTSCRFEEREKLKGHYSFAIFGGEAREFGGESSPPPPPVD